MQDPRAADPIGPGSIGGIMASVLRAGAAEASGTTWPVQLPAVAVGQRTVLVVAFKNSTAQSLTPPNGFSIRQQVQSSRNGGRLVVLERAAATAAAAASTLSLTFSGAVTGAWASFAVDGSFSAASASENGYRAGTFAVPGVTAAQPASAWVQLVATVNWPRTFQAPSGTTLSAQSGGSRYGPSLAVGSRTVAAGATGTATWTVGPDGDEYIAVSLAYSPNTSGFTPGSPPRGVLADAGGGADGWILKHTDAAVTVPAKFIGMHAHRYPACPSPPSSSISAAFQYEFDVIRLHDYEWSALRYWFPSAGTYNWAGLDNVIAFHQNAGRRIVYTFSQMPQHLTGGGPLDPYNLPGGGAPARAGDVARLKAAVTAFAARYAGRLVYEIGNEYEWVPGVSGYFWTGTSGASIADSRRQYVQGFARPIVEGIRAADPNATILNFAPVNKVDENTGATNLAWWNGTATDTITTWANEPDGAGGVGRDLCNAVSFHWYDFNNTPWKLHNVIRGYKRSYYETARVPAGRKLYLTEIGSDGWTAGTPSDAEKVVRIQRWCLIAAAHGCQMIGLYAHEQQGTLGRPETNLVVRNGITQIRNRLSGKQIRQAAVQSDHSVWVRFSDNTEVTV